MINSVNINVPFAGSGRERNVQPDIFNELQVELRFRLLDMTKVFADQ